ncbi:MAG TPA: hypothetical protein VLN73_05445 [Alphaproteobacteria bacterium]|nr:hypothetical protein [Alphaproteobacteria bacterium]
MKLRLGFALGVLTASVMPVGAQADALDGGWCYSDGKRLFINGSEIMTPGGNRITGDYRRHSFTYKIPPKEPGAGMIVHMQQLDEETMHMTLGTGPDGGGGGPAQTWRRCPKGTS